MRKDSNTHLDDKKLITTNGLHSVPILNYLLLLCSHTQQHFDAEYTTPRSSITFCIAFIETQLDTFLQCYNYF